MLLGLKVAKPGVVPGKAGNGGSASASMQASTQCGWMLWYVIATTPDGVVVDAKQEDQTS